MHARKIYTKTEEQNNIIIIPLIKIVEYSVIRCNENKPFKEGRFKNNPLKIEELNKELMLLTLLMMLAQLTRLL